MVVEILFSVAMLLIFAKIFGEITERLKFSSLPGEIIGGLIAGLLGLVLSSPLIAELAGFGILFVIFLIGLQTNFDDVKGNLNPGILLSTSGAVLSFIFGFAAGYYTFGFEAGLVFGIALLSTSTFIAVRSVSDVGELHSKAGKMITAINTVSEIIAILSFSILVSYFTFASETWKIIAIFFLLFVFLLLVISYLSKFVGKLLLFFEEMNDDQFIIALSLVLVFLLSFLTQQIGIASITGAFIAGLLLNKSLLAEKAIAPKIKTISYGFFAPLFFAYSALFLDISSIYSNLGIILLLFVLAVLAKLLGCGIFSGYYGFRGREQLTVGIGTIPRGEYSIIVTYIALTMGIITQQIYTVVMISVFLSMLLTPLLFRKFVKNW